MKHLFYSLTIVITAVSCGIDPSVKEQYEPQYYEVKDSLSLTKAEVKAAEQVREFNINHFKALANFDYKYPHPTENLLISPFLISYEISVMSAGFSFETDDDIQSIFGPENSSYTDVLSYHKKVSDKLAAKTEGMDIAIANAYWSGSLKSLNPKYVEIMNSYGVHAEKLDFHFNAKQSYDRIYDWTAEVTGNKIGRLTPEFSTYADGICGIGELVESALYFKGLWNTDRYETAQMEFSDYEGIVSTDTFFGLDSLFYYYNDEEASAVVLPYVEDSYQLIVILPNQATNINEYISSMTIESFDKMISQAKLSRVNFKMPVLEESTPADNSEALYRMPNLISCMNSNEKNELFNLEDWEAHFSTLFKERKLPSSTDSWLEYTLSISPDGTSSKCVPNYFFIKDAGIGMDAMATRSDAIDPTHYDFIANRPFVYAIVERTSGAILFMGTHVK